MSNRIWNFKIPTLDHLSERLIGYSVTISVGISASSASDISIQIVIMGSVENSIMIEALDAWCRSTTGRGNNYVTAGYNTKNVRTKKCATRCAGTQRWIVRPDRRTVNIDAVPVRVLEPVVVRVSTLKLDFLSRIACRIAQAQSHIVCLREFLILNII